MSIRAMLPRDAKAVAKLWRSTKELWPDDKIKFQSEKSLKEWLSDKGNDLLIVYEKNQKIIGFLTATVLPYKSACIDDLAVVPVQRGKGIAGELHDYAIKYFKNKKVEFVYCWVKGESQSSRRFWKKKGFNEGKSFVFAWKTI